MKKKSRSDAWGIRNHLGGIWTPQTFGSEMEAIEYLRKKRSTMKGLDNHAVVRVRLSIIRPAEAGKPRKVL